jgi:hypothetical protein
LKKEKIILNNKIVEIITELDEELKKDEVLIEKDDTIDLSEDVKKIKEELEKTAELELDNKNE